MKKHGQLQLMGKHTLYQSVLYKVYSRLVKQESIRLGKHFPKEVSLSMRCQGRETQGWASGISMYKRGRKTQPAWRALDGHRSREESTFS